MNARQQRETMLVREFLQLELVGIPVSSVTPSDRPDVIVEIDPPGKDGCRQIGLELTDYFNDGNTQGRGSEGQRMLSFWKDVQDEIESLRDKTSGLLHIHVWFRLDKRALLKAGLARLSKDFAREAFSFVLEESETSQSDVLVIPEWQERTLTEFGNYKVLTAYVKEAIIHKGFYARWDSNLNGSYVGIDPQTLGAIICTKNKKAKSYDKARLDRLWLLIAAPHDSAFNAMHGHPEHIDFGAPEIAEACARTPFDKIFFWSSKPHEWYEQVWPRNQARRVLQKSTRGSGNS